MLVSCFPGTRAFAQTLDTARFIDGAFLKYEAVFVLPTTPARFSRMLDNLFLMGQLWDVYGFSPKYRINRIGGSYHVIDPTGLEGILRTVSLSGGERKFLADGRLKQWYIPMTITGRALFILRYSPSPGGISVRFTVYGEGSPHRIEQALLKAVSPLLAHHIGRRITKNLADLSIIIADMETRPDETARKLGGFFRGEIERISEP